MGAGRLLIPVSVAMLALATRSNAEDPKPPRVADREYYFVNDELIREPYVGALYRPHENFGPVDVPDGNYFLMGDHRNRSSDSRIWGPAPRELIKGRAFMVLFSTSAAPPSDVPPGQVTLGSLGRKLINLVFHSRWDRFLSFVR